MSICCQGICRYAIDYTSQMYDQYLPQIKLPFGVNWVRGDIIMCSESIVTGDLVSSWLAVSISSIHRDVLSNVEEGGGTQ